MNALAALREDHELDLATLFDAIFQVIPARRPDLLDQVHKLRYEVYCVENPFEKVADHPDGREKDRFDLHAVHSALIHRPSESVVGCVRLILPHNGEDARLPIQEIVSPEYRQVLDALPKGKTAEISRYAVSKSFRRRQGEDLYADIGFPYAERMNERRVMPHVTLGLLKGALQLCVEHGVTHLCAVMEPSLLRLVTRMGLNFHPVGPTVSYHGTRQPTFAVLEELDQGFLRKQGDFYDVVTRNTAP